MRKLFFVFLFICFVCKDSYAQDLIVTKVGDSLACRIIKQTEEYVHFSYTKYNYNSVRQLMMSRVQSIIPGFYHKRDSLRAAGKHVLVDSLPIQSDTLIFAEQPGAKVTATDTSITLIVGDVVPAVISKWQFGINAGYAYRLFKPRIKATPYQLKYIDEIKSGYSFGFDVYYFHWKHVGVGFKYDIYKSRGVRDFRTKDDITIQFLGLSVAHRAFLLNDRTSLISAFWLGYQPYRNKAMFVGQNYTLNANTMGWGVSVGVDQKISPKLAIGLTGSCFISSAYKVSKQFKGVTETINLPTGIFEDLSRVELTLGLKFVK